MGRITLELIRKKAEHHDGLLEDLEELTLHQLNLEKLDTIGRVCPRLKILYLQNNLIPRLENLRRLTSLKYLNCALNNITEIPAEISKCEKLRKLDLTLNFIDVDVLASSIAALGGLVDLDELYLTGNPCTQWGRYRPYVVARLNKLDKLDGVEVTKGERLTAKASAAADEAELATLADQKRLEKGAAAASKARADGERDDDDIAEEKEAAEAAAAASSSSSSSLTPEAAALAKKAAAVSAYTPESRRQMHLESEAQEAKKEADKKASQKGNQPEDLWKAAQNKMNQKVLEADLEGDQLPKQRNMGKWDFTLGENAEKDAIVVDIAVQRFLDTSLIDIDVHPGWFQAIIKGKSLLLHFPQEVRAEECRVQRIQANGHLVLTCPKVKKVGATTHSSANASAGIARPGGATLELAEGDEREEEEEAELAASEAAQRSRSTAHSNVVDLSARSSGGGSAAASSSSSASAGTAASSVPAFVKHNTGGSLNQSFDYRHIARKRTAAEAAEAKQREAQMTEITATRSATLEQARVQRQEEAQQSKRADAEAERAQLESLGLDDSGVPDLE